MIVLRTLVFGVDLPGYASLIVAVLFLGGFSSLASACWAVATGSSMSNDARTISFEPCIRLRAVALKPTLAVGRIEKATDCSNASLSMPDAASGRADGSVQAPLKHGREEKTEL